MKMNAVCIFALLTLCNVAYAAKGEPLDLQVRYGKYHTTFVVNEDGTAVETREWSMTILKEAAIDWTKRASISYSTSAQKGEIVEAYTKKADGKRIDVPKDNYQLEINKGKEKDAPVFSDITTLSVVFPDVAVGDTVVFAYKLTQTEPLFPKHFTEAETISNAAYDDVRVRFDYPSSLWVQYEARGMTEKEKSEKDGRKVIEWTFTNPKPLKSERENYSVYDPDKETGYAFSTLKSYADLAAAYGARATPKAAVTERVQKLADEIVKGKESPKDQARALYEWVATKITYGGNCIGIGAVVPHDLSFVLDNKMGDCKDHATLLQALLAARGIKSIQVLINSGSVYSLPKIPVVSRVNHVINYIPSLDLYVDSTSDSTPFGLLPFQDQDKPVLWVEGFKDGTKTPVPAVGSSQVKTISAVKIASDGSISGTVEVFQKGPDAVATRAMARKMTKEFEEDFVKNSLRARGAVGSGKFEKDDPTVLTDSYHFKATLNSEKFTKFPGAGAFYIYPLIGGGAIQNALQTPAEIEKEADVVCWGGMLVEEYTIELPKSMKILSVPDDFKLSNGFLSYNATHKLKGNVLTVKRTYDDRTKGNTCSPKVFAEYKTFADKVTDNLKEQVLYK